MARIRSIHPGLFTDEAFMALSSDGQVFFLGLWTEADDQGVFEWKPLTLKVRLRGGKDGAVEPLLEELTAVNSIQRYEVGGRVYGAIRNFRKFQRPKKPNAIHPITDEIRTYVALSAANPEPSDDEHDEVLHQFGTGTEKSPQREDGGGRMKDEGGTKKTSGVASQLPAVLGPVFITLPTNRFESQGEEVPIYQPFVEEMQSLYPAIAVGDQLRAMRAWLITNAEKRKTRSGMKRFINGWLSKSQDRGAPRETIRGFGNGRGKPPSANDKNLAGAALAIASFGDDDDEPREAAADRDAGRPVLPFLDA